MNTESLLRKLQPYIEDLQKENIHDPSVGIRYDHDLEEITFAIREALSSPAPEVAATSDQLLKQDQVKQIAGIAWRGAANAFRLYPENSHTFAAYWDAAKSQFSEFTKSEPVSGVAAPTGGSEGKHTPGPWKVTRRRNVAIGPESFEVRSHKGLLIANINYGASEVEANAELIARAPETARELAALKALLARIRPVLAREIGSGNPMVVRIDAALGEKTATKD